MTALKLEPRVRLRIRRTKIIATVGNASGDEATLRNLIRAGVNVMRLNFSHGTLDEHAVYIRRIRKVSEALNQPVAILGDLSGPKIRVGEFDGGGIELRVGDDVRVTTRRGVRGRPGLIPSQYEKLVHDVTVGQRILFDDGNIELEVRSKVDDDTLHCRVVRGGFLSNHKGINLPGIPLSVPAITEKDRRDLAFCIEHGVDYVALSFVRRASEIEELKSLIQEHEDRWGRNPLGRTGVIAKIEKPEALNEIEAIIDASDGIMIARGDLGVELPAEKVPIIQRQLIRMANQRNKPAIVATQMLESMIEHARPTRAEVNDVASAVMSRTDAVMLSGETAVGKYPIESVRVMDAVCREVESYLWSEGQFGRLSSDISIYPLANALARACTLLSQDMEIHAVNILTRSGRTARILSVARPNSPILAYARDIRVVRKMQLYWGVVPIHLDKELTLETFADEANETVKRMGIAKAGDYLLLVSSPLKDYVRRPLNSIIVFQVV